MDDKHCAGCSEDFYNNKNPQGIKQCWQLKDAKLVDRIPIGHWENPPYLNKPIVKVPNCWHGIGPSRTHYVDPKTIREDGHWK